MALIIEDIHKVQLQFKSLSNPADVTLLQSMAEFDSEEEADKFMKKVLSICAPIHDAKKYEVGLSHRIKKTSSEIPR